MADPIPNTATGDGHARSHTGGSETGLRAEIAFWKEMLETCGKETPPESRERMGFALALAENKLNSLFEEHAQSGITAGNIGKVLYLDLPGR